MAGLNQAIEEAGLEIPAIAYAPLKHYCQRLWEINKTMNLTRHTSYEKFVSRDLLDTLQLSKLIPENQEVLDIGSGGGVPGIVLAILRPDLEITLCESVGKKAHALGELAKAAELDLEIYHCRAEDLLQDFRYDYSVARAVGPLRKMGVWFEGRWPALGRLLATKGPRWLEEKKEADESELLKKVDLRVVAEYEVPGVEWKSVILQLKASR